MEKYQILKDLVGFNTIKDKENHQIINYLEGYLKERGFKTEYKDKNLIMSYGENPSVGFLGHTDTVEYIMSEQEMQRKLSDIKDRKYTISRSKGLGELEPKVMRETAMNPETRILIKVMVEDVEEMQESFNVWMSDSGLSDRKKYIEENLYKVRVE